MTEQSLLADSAAKGRVELPISSNRILLFWIITLGIAILGAFLLGEVALRAAGFPAIGIDTRGRVVDWPIVRTDYRGGSYPPGSWRQRHDDYDVEWKINDHGFRERPFSSKAPGEYRIGLFGNSFTAGHGVEVHERFGTLWQEAIGQEYRGVTVWNFATGLMGTANAADIMRGLGREYDLDEVILAFYAGNDLDDNRDWYEVELNDEGNPIPPSNLWRSFRDWGRAHSRVLSVVGSKLLAAFGPPKPPAGVFERDRLEELWPYTERALDELRRALGNKPLTIWYLPSDAEWEDALWKTAQTQFSYAQHDRFVLRDRLLRWTKAHGVGMVDVTPVLAGSSINEARFPRDPHWNALGHRLVAAGLIHAASAAAISRHAQHHE